MPAIWNSKSKSDTARRPRTIMQAPSWRAKSISRPWNDTPPMTVPLRSAISRVSAWTSSTRSSSENSGPLPVLMETPMPSLSISRAARPMMSTWPLVTGSNVPGYRPMRCLLAGSGPGLSIVVLRIPIGDLALRIAGRVIQYDHVRCDNAELFGVVLGRRFFQHGEHAGNPLIGVHPQQQDAHRLPARHAHLIAGHPDQPSGIGHQHDIVALANRERGRHG